MCTPGGNKIHLSSVSRVSGTVSEGNLNLSSSPTINKYIRLLSFTMKNSLYSFNNDVLHIEEQTGALPLTFTLNGSWQTPTVLATYLSTQLTAASPNLLVYTMTYDPILFKMTLTATGNFKFTIIQLYQFRFPLNTAYSTTFTSEFIDLTPIKGLGLIIRNLPYCSCSSSNFSAQFFIPASADTGETIEFAANGIYDNKICIKDPLKLNNIEYSIIDGETGAYTNFSTNWVAVFDSE